MMRLQFLHSGDDWYFVHDKIESTKIEIRINEKLFIIDSFLQKINR